MSRSTGRCLEAPELAALITIAAAALGLRLWGLGAENLWVDEAWSLWLAEGNLAVLMEMARVDVHPPLYYLLLHIWIPVAGISEAALRLPSVLFSTAAVVMTYAVGRQLVGRWAAWVGAVMLAVSPFQLYYAQEARSYALLLLLSVISMWWFVSMLADSSLRNRCGWLLTTTLLLYCHYIAVFLVASQYLVFAVAWAGQRIRGARSKAHSGLTPRQFFVLQGACALLFLPGVALMLEQANGVPGDFWLPAMSWGGVGNLLGLLVGSAVLPGVAPAPWHLVAVIAGLALLAITGLGASRPGRFPAKANDPEALPGWLRSTTLAIWLLGPVVLVACLSWFGIEVFTVRNLIFIAPAFALATAELSLSVSQPSLRALVLALLLAAPTANLPGYYRAERKERWRAAGNFASRIWQDGDPVVADAWFVQRLFEYYLGHTTTTVDVFSDPLEDEERLWLVRSHSRDPSRNIHRALVKNGLRPVVARQYPRIEVVLYARAGSETEAAKGQSTSVAIPEVRIILRPSTEPIPTSSTP